MFEIVIALTIFWRFLTIQEIIVERDANRMDSINSQLNTQTLAGSCFSRRRRTSNQHQLYTLSLSNLVSNLGNLLLL